MNWLNISCDEELYDISKCVFLRCLREFEKWSWIEKIGKNEEKMRKKFGLESPNIHYCQETHIRHRPP